MGNVILSICIPVYNQRELLKKLLRKLIVFDDSDFEIVICDNASSENIESLLSELNDSRIVYYRNEVNIGHDLNILQCLKKAKGDYAYLLRTKDFLLPGSLHEFFNIIRHYPNVSLFVSSCVFGESDLSDNYDLAVNNQEKDQIYSKGLDAFIQSLYLWDHPFGVMYAVKKLNLDNIERYLLSVPENDRKIIYSITEILHYDAAISGDIMTISRLLWVHGDDYSSEFPSANTGVNVLHPFDPKIRCFNFELLSQYVFQNFPSNFAQIYIINNFKKVLRSITYEFKIKNANPLFRKHYLVDRISHDNSFERKKLFQITSTIVNKYIDDKKVVHYLLRKCKQDILYNRTIDYFTYLGSFASEKSLKYIKRHPIIKKYAYIIGLYVRRIIK